MSDSPTRKAALRLRLKRLLHAAVTTPGTVRLLRRLLRFVTTTPDGCHSTYAALTFPQQQGAVIPLQISNADIPSQLDQIPSETTALERRFLYDFFATWWDGQHDVLEVGPFLGGTTRAIALGMLANPRRQSGCRLYTFDRFRDYYYSTDEFVQYLEPLFSAGLLPPELKETVRRSNSFREVFDRLHAQQPYRGLLVAKDALLPETEEELNLHPNLFVLEPTQRFSAVFVDGCKSWFATRYFFSQTLPASAAGAFYLFQDYGWYKCFWIPIILNLLSDTFHLKAYGDFTYVFQVVRPLPTNELLQRCPACPEAFPPEWYTSTFEELRDQAHSRGDRRGYVSLTLQNAAALAYLGDSKGARELIRLLAISPIAKGYEHWLEAAAKNPTYRPSGKGLQPTQIYLAD